jgi:hypothetical protein
MAKANAAPPPHFVTFQRLPIHMRRRFGILRWLLVTSVLISFRSAMVVAAEKPAARPTVQFRTARAGIVSINLYRPDGVLVRRLVKMQRFNTGAQKVVWDGLADDGTPLPPGEYTWKGIFHEGIGLKLRGWAANSGATPWPTPDGKGDWGGDDGVPSAVAADAQQVYLGWSLANEGKAILACDLEGRIRWSHRRAEGPSGCKALGIDDGKLYVLGGLEGVDAEGGAIYRLDVKDGKVVPWPDGRVDLKITSLWPANSENKPESADAMAVRKNRIYLTFTEPSFLSVLEARTGAYINTVVGPPPGQIDVISTQTDLPDAPGKLVDADFAVVSLGGGVLGKALLSHDPFWVITSELSPTVRDVRIGGLTIMGDNAKFHRHHAFVGYDVPFHQVQMRPVLDIESVTWTAGRTGGRPLLGPWQADGMRAIRGLAIDAAGKLWVAEGDGSPKRFSVWDTTGKDGKLVRDFMGPAWPGGRDGAINPLDPDLMYAQGCEWRIDRKTGRATCLGVVMRDGGPDARYAVGENGSAYLAVSDERQIDILERIGDGDYKLRSRLYAPESDPVTGKALGKTIVWADENGDGDVQPGEEKPTGQVWTIPANMILQDLTLSAYATGGEGRVLKVQSWSPCGAPRYDFAQVTKWAERVWPSADYRYALSSSHAANESHQLVCRTFPDGAERWKIAFTGETHLVSGPALLPAPVGNVWLMHRAKNGTAEWTLINEDGFEVSHLFAADEKSVRWPKVATPGADLSNATVKYPGRLAQGADGKLYLQAGDSAYWNLEVTGLDKVRALAGGSVTIPASR